MTIKYCLPLIVHDLQTTEQIIRENRQRFDLFELWIDPIEQLDLRSLAAFLNRWPSRLILNLRAPHPQSQHHPLPTRLASIKLLEKQDIFLDLDILQQQKELAFFQSLNAPPKLILSYHDYQRTPPLPDLWHIIDQMAQHRPYLYKIATHCQHPHDALRLMEINLQLKEEKRPHIILGMGQYGGITRTYGTLWGNEWIFAPLAHEQATALGQYTRDELECFFSIHPLEEKHSVKVHLKR